MFWGIFIDSVLLIGLVLLVAYQISRYMDSRK